VRSPFREGAFGNFGNLCTDTVRRGVYAHARIPTYSSHVLYSYMPHCFIEIFTHATHTLYTRAIYFHTLHINDSFSILFNYYSQRPRNHVRSFLACFPVVADRRPLNAVSSIRSAHKLPSHQDTQTGIPCGFLGYVWFRFGFAGH